MGLNLDGFQDSRLCLDFKTVLDLDDNIHHGTDRAGGSQATIRAVGLQFAQALDAVGLAVFRRIPCVGMGNPPDAAGHRGRKGAVTLGGDRKVRIG